MEGGRARRWLRVIGHDGEELLFVDLAVLVEVELVDHGLSVREKSQIGANGAGLATRTTRRPRGGRQSPSRRALGSVG